MITGEVIMGGHLANIDNKILVGMIGEYIDSKIDNNLGGLKK